MKRLDPKTRAQVLHALMEGVSIRATARMTGVSKTTILKLIEDAGQAAAWYQDRVFQNLNSKRIQVDEIWGFVGAKQKNVATAKRKDTAYGDAWLWIATDADTKLVPSWLVGGRDGAYAMALMDDLRSRLANRIQLTTDGHKAYLDAVEGAFGGDIDYAMLVKIYGAAPEGEKRYSPADGAPLPLLQFRPSPSNLASVPRHGRWRDRSPLGNEGRCCYAGGLGGC